MSQRRISISLFALLFVTYIGLFAWQQAVFFQKQESFYDELHAVMTSSREGDWARAAEKAENVESMWERGKVIISIKSGGTNQALLNISLKQLKGAIKEKDLKSAIREGETSMMLFENLTSVTPRF